MQTQAAKVSAVWWFMLQAYCGQTDQVIRVEASLFVNRFSVRVYHRGDALEPVPAGPPPPERPGAKDTGWDAVRRRVDEVQCSRSTHGEHCVFLQKWLKQ